MKDNANKKRYNIKELEFELNFVAKKSGTLRAGSALWDVLVPVTAEGNYSKDQIQKVKITLIPKNESKNNPTMKIPRIKNNL
jgi:hypothetical protein